MPGPSSDGARALDAHDADIALAELAEQLRAVARLVDLEPVDVEHDRPAEEKPGRTGGQIVEPRQPVVERQLRREHQREEGSALEADRPGVC